MILPNCAPEYLGSEQNKKREPCGKKSSQKALTLQLTEFAYFYEFACPFRYAIEFLQCGNVGRHGWKLFWGKIQQVL